MILKNSRHERFAQLVAGGADQSQAYREVYPRSRTWTKNAVRVAACHVAKKTQARVRELLELPAQDLVASRMEVARFYTRVIRTPIGAVNEDSDLAQEKTTRTLVGEEEGVVEKIKMTCKASAAEGLRRMLGYDEPEKEDHTFRFQPTDAVLAKLAAAAQKKAKEK